MSSRSSQFVVLFAAAVACGPTMSSRGTTAPTAYTEQPLEGISARHNRYLQKILLNRKSRCQMHSATRMVDGDHAVRSPQRLPEFEFAPTSTAFHIPLRGSLPEFPSTRTRRPDSNSRTAKFDIGRDGRDRRNIFWSSHPETCSRHWGIPAGKSVPPQIGDGASASPPDSALCIPRSDGFRLRSPRRIPARRCSSLHTAYT